MISYHGALYATKVWAAGRTPGSSSSVASAIPYRDGALGSPEFIYNRRAADATEASKTTGRGFVERHQIFALHPFEIADLDTGTAAKRGSVLFAAHRAMTVARCRKRAVDLKLDAAA